MVFSSFSMTLPVKVMVRSSIETSEDSATDYIRGNEDLQILYNTGVTCKGNFVNIISRKSGWVFNCNDGWSDQFKFDAPRNSGTDYGDLANTKITFKFENF